MNTAFLHRVSLVALLFVAVSCATPAANDNDMPTINPANWPTTTGGVPLDPAIEARIGEIMATMTVEELVAQTIQADIGSITPEEVREYRLGSVLNGGNSAPNADVRAPAPEWVALADEFYAASMDTTGGRKAIPLLWGSDAVHGHGNIVGATVFPHNIGLGAMRNPELMRQIGRVTAIEMLVTGLDWTFAPTIAVVRNDRWGRTYEGYSEDPEILPAYSRAMVEGLQGTLGSDEFLDANHVISTAKHFIGDGGTRDGIDQGDNYDSEADLRDNHGAGYPAAVEAGVQSVMASFNTWHDKKMHGHEALLTQVLKERMGFNGFVVGDWNGHGQVEGCENTSCAASMNAGVDMFMAPDSWRGLYENTLAQVQSGEIPRERLDDAVRRILRVKLRAGMFEKAKPSARPMAGDYDVLGAPEHLEVARLAVRESLVLLKNQGGLLPLRADQRVLVAGDGADDIGKQSGGWTLSWQGTGNTNADFPGGVSIYAGLREAIEAGGGTATLSVDGTYSQAPDVAVVVFGEDPYAEFMGDREHVDFDDDRGLNLLRSFKEAGIPTVAIFLSGRAMWVNPEMNAADAFVAAWLPGSQGGGVADVLVRTPGGDVAHDFKGKLSYSWPRTAVQVKLNRGDADYDPLFAYGYGLTYGDDGDMEMLSEVSGLSDDGGDSGVFFAAGEAAAPWSLQGTSGGTAVTVVDAVTPVGDALTIRSVDRAAQEDAKQATWSGGAAAAVQVSGEAMDYARESNGDMAIAIQYRVDAAPEGNVAMFVTDASGAQTALDVTALFAEAAIGEWTQSDIKLSCFAEAGADVAALTTVLGIETSAAFALSLSDVRLASNEGRAICP
ncbi:MAG: exo 1,3/1,4-beta-D-glucan glucohydrolase [Bacteroidota bacterium]